MSLRARMAWQSYVKTHIDPKKHFHRRAAEDAEDIIFCLAERWRQTKRFPSFQYEAHNRWYSPKRVESCSRRDGVSASIAVSQLKQKKYSLCDLCASAVKPGLEGAADACLPVGRAIFQQPVRSLWGMA